MKFLIDENLGIKVSEFLRDLGFDIVSITELSPGITDKEVLSLANDQERILVTLDKDFGELVFKEGLTYFGVILVRLKDESVDNKKKVLKQTLMSGKDFTNKFTVIEG